MEGILQEDGKITEIYPVEIEKAGAAAEVIGSSSDNESANTVYGAKAYADTKIQDALSWEEVE